MLSGEGSEGRRAGLVRARKAVVSAGSPGAEPHGIVCTWRQRVPLCQSVIGCGLPGGGTVDASNPPG